MRNNKIKNNCSLSPLKKGIIGDSVYAFTLIEVIVSVSIFSIMSISIIWIYIISLDINMKSDINRLMQENLKNVSNKIAEDIRKDWIIGVSTSTSDSCDFNVWTNKYKNWSQLCTKSGNTYYLAKKIGTDYLRAETTDCSDIKDNCIITIWINNPLTNSYVSVKDLQFYVSRDTVPKVTISITLQPSINKWVKPELIKNSKLIFQTTISERPF